MSRIIAAGVGGTGGWQALAWAADEAVQTGARLVLLRGLDRQSPLVAFDGAPPPARLELADLPLARAFTAARAKLGGTRVTLRTLTGDPGTALANATANTDLLVVGAGGGNTVRRIVRHALCPVVVVHSLPGGCDGPLAGHVVVGVDDTAAGLTAVEYAFEYSDEHRRPLAVVHVTPAAPADTHWGYAAPPEGAEPDPAELLGRAVEPWMRKYPRTSVRPVVRRGSVADELVRSAVGAHLLVVGDRHRGLLSRALTHDVALAVVHRAECPVAVIPLERRERGLP